MKRASAVLRIDTTDSDADPSLLEAALAPDDTAEMESRVEGDVLETQVARESVGGLRSTVDDYVTNLSVALRVAALAIALDERTGSRDDSREVGGEDDEASPTDS